MMFRSRSDYPPPAFTPHGSDLIPEYTRKKQDDGSFQLEEVGQIDVYARIQAASSGLDVYSLLDAYQRTGDPSVLQQQKGRYADIHGVDLTLAQLEQFRIDSKTAFDSLPARIRDLFGQSFENFIRNPDKAAAVLDELDRQTKGLVKKTNTSNPGSASNSGAGSAASIGGEQQ